MDDKVGRAQHIRNQLSELAEYGGGKQPSVRHLHKLGGGDESTISKIVNGDPDALETVRESSFLQLERTLREMYLAFGAPVRDERPDLVFTDEAGNVTAIAEAKTSGQGDAKVVVVRFEGVTGSSLEIEKITVESTPEDLPGAIESVRKLFERAQGVEPDEQ